MEIFWVEVVRGQPSIKVHRDDFQIYSDSIMIVFSNFIELHNVFFLQVAMKFSLSAKPGRKVLNQKPQVSVSWGLMAFAILRRLLLQHLSVLDSHYRDYGADFLPSNYYFIYAVYIYTYIYTL